jgi:hypothetical protein
MATVSTAAKRRFMRIGNTSFCKIRENPR